MQTRFAASKLARYLHQTLAAVDHHLHCLAFVLLRIHRVLSLFCFHRVLFLSLSSRVRQIGGGSASLSVTESHERCRTVEGIVAKVFTSKSGNTFLNIGTAYPNQIFTGWIPPTSLVNKSPLLSSIEGKHVKITVESRYTKESRKFV